MIIEKLNSGLYWIIIGVLFLNLMQRKHYPHAAKKRMATLLLTVLILVLNIFIALILQFKLPDWAVIPAVLITVTIGFLIRKRLIIFKIKCVECKKQLTFNNIFYNDDNLCDSCRKQLHPELFPNDPRPDEKTPAEIIQERCKDARDTGEIDWDTWEPAEKASICYIFHEGNVLLIHKKVGLGSGLINAPGGRIEKAETAKEAAIRETEEETGLTPLGVTEVGVLNFQFIDGYSLKGYVFFADSFKGTLTRTDEADPFWVSEDAIPYENMWVDDALWLPKAISGSYVQGKFIFDDRTMLSSEIIERER